MSDSNSSTSLPLGEATCPNCGAASSGSPYCAHCGAPLQPAPHRLHPALKILLRIVLFIAALGLGGLGACAGLIGLLASGDSSGAYGQAFSLAQLMLLVVVPLMAASACLWLFNKLAKK